jgi:hypothetical protein
MHWPVFFHITKKKKANPISSKITSRSQKEKIVGDVFESLSNHT